VSTVLTQPEHQPALLRAYLHDPHLPGSRKHLRVARQAGLEICSADVGMGESDEDVVDLALQLSEFDVDSLPINFWLPSKASAVNQTPLKTLDPRYCLKVLPCFDWRIPGPSCG